MKIASSPAAITHFRCFKSQALTKIQLICLLIVLQLFNLMKGSSPITMPRAFSDESNLATRPAVAACREPAQVPTSVVLFFPYM